jgi:NitT/TauT family transport system ATP-binding protein
MAEPKISVRHLTKVYGQSSAPTTAFTDVTLSIAEGEFICILGPSGCGKSTFLLCVAGLEQATSGEILIDGKPAKGPGPDRGIVFQEYALFPWRTVRGNVNYGLETAGLPKDEQRRIASHFIRMVGLENFENRYPFQLSGGMKQRVAIARALAVDPGVLLMDEPFGALDAMTRASLQNETVRVWQSTRKTVLFVTHSVSEAILLADRVFLFSGRPGHIRAEIEVKLPRPRDVKSRKFVEIQSRIEALVHEEHPPQFESEAAE